MLLLLALACTFGVTDNAPCSSNAQCRAAFGWGSVCDTDGLCAQVEPHARCTETIPADLFDARDQYSDIHLVGVNYDDTSFEAEVKAMRLAVNQVNTMGGLDGEPFGLVVCTNEENTNLDSLTQEEANVEVAVWLADSLGAPGTIGPATSTRVEAAFLAVEPYGHLVMSPSATSPALTALDGLTSTNEDPGLLWRTAPPDDLQGEVIARCMTGGCTGVDLDVRRALVVYETGAYGEGLEEAFYENFVGEGRTADLVPFANATERDEAVVQAGHGDYEEVLFIASEKEDVLAFLFGAGQLDGFTRDTSPVGIFLSDGAYYLDVYQDAADVDELFDQIHGTRPTIAESAVLDSFTAAYAAAYDGEDARESAYTAYAYDATWLVIYGTAWSHYLENGETGLGIARGLRRVSAGEDVDIKSTSWSTVTASFEVGQAIDVRGASGELDYDPETGETSAPIEVWTVEKVGNTYEFGVATTIEP